MGVWCNRHSTPGCLHVSYQLAVSSNIGLLVSYQWTWSDTHDETVG